MAGEKRFTRIPPESTGDRVYMIHTAEIEFKNGGESVNALYGGHTWQIGDFYDIEGFGGNGKVHVHGVFDRGDGTGILAVHYNKTAKFENFEPAADAIISFMGTSVGQVDKAYDVYVPAQNIMGYDNPEYGLDIDPFGSANVRFAEGQPQLDAFGKLRVTGATHLGEYVYSNPLELYENYSTTFLNTGNRSIRTASVFHNNTGKYIQVELNSQQDFAAATTNTYHHYVPGSSHLFMGTMKLSNEVGPLSGAPYTNNGCERNFGTFDANNGFMFRIGPTGVLYLIRRTSASGSVKNYVLASSDTTDGFDNFNRDRINGVAGPNSPSGMDLDVTKDNIYWIDVQWHGAGRVRFGTFNRGQRLVIHEYYHGNIFEEAMTQTISLPVCHAGYFYSDAEMQAHAVYGDGSGTGGDFGGLPSDLVRIGLTSSSTNAERYLRSWSGSVWTENDLDLQSLGRPKTYTTGHLPVNGLGFAQLFSISPNEILSTGSVDRSLFIPTKIAAYAYDNNVTTTGTNRAAIVHYRVGVDCVHSGHDFKDIPGTDFQVSTTGTSFEDTNKPGVTKAIAFEDMFDGRFEDVLTDRFINIQGGAFKNKADDGGVHEHVIDSFDPNIATTFGVAANDSGVTDLVVDDAAVSLTAAGAAAQYTTTITVADTTGVVLGGVITAQDDAAIPTLLIPEGTTVLAINGNTITLSKPTLSAIPDLQSITHIALVEGAAVSGTGVDADTVIKSVNSSTSITLNKATTAAFAGTETLTQTRPSVVTIDPSQDTVGVGPGDRWILREPQTATFPLNAQNGALHLHGINGTGTNPFPRTGFIKIISLTKAYIYADQALTQPIDTTAFTYTDGGVIHGFVGSRSIFTFFAHEQIKDMQDPRVMFTITWKEIVQ